MCVGVFPEMEGGGVCVFPEMEGGVCVCVWCVCFFPEVKGVCVCVCVCVCVWCVCVFFLKWKGCVRVVCPVDRHGVDGRAAA